MPNLAPEKAQRNRSRQKKTAQSQAEPEPDMAQPTPGPNPNIPHLAPSMDIDDDGSDCQDGNDAQGITL